MASISGVLALYKDPNALMEAAEKVRERDYKHWDCYTPFPVHGLDNAMGIKRSWIPYVTFGAGLTGALTALALEIGTSAWDWPINVAGKPYNSLPAFIPITFELTVLFAGLCTAGTMLAVNGLRPDPFKKVLDPRITNDRFAIFIPSIEKSYNESEIVSFLKGLHADEVRVVTE